MNSCCRVALHVSESDSVHLHVGSEVYSPDIYRGEYEVTPSQSEQVLETADKLLRENVVVAPIPYYYGLITYNGSIITVS